MCVAAPSAPPFVSTAAIEPLPPQQHPPPPPPPPPPPQQLQLQQVSVAPAGGVQEHHISSSYMATNGNEAVVPNGSAGNGGEMGTSGPAEAVPAAAAASAASEPWSPAFAPGTKKKSPSKSVSKVGGRGGKARAKSKKKNASPSLIANWECIDDGGVCNVCFDSQSYDENPIMRCDSCKVAVHQHCYGCRAGPQDGRTWFCDPCSNGENTSMLACSLCAETGVRGGAMKMVTPGVERSRHWVHVCCTMWIPEVFVGSDELEPVHLEFVPKDRKTLKCVLCGKRGVCVQCAGGRCLVAYHPWCLLHTDKKSSLLFRSLDTKGNLNVYCRKHIADIKVPLDLPEKDSQLGPRSFKEARERISPKLLVYVPVPQIVPDKGGKSGRAGANGKQGGGSKSKASKKRARNQKGPSIIDVEGGSLGIQNHPPLAKHSKTYPQHLPLAHNPGRKRRKKFGPSPGAKNGQVEEPPSVEREAALMDTKDRDVDEEGNLVLHTLWDKAGAPRIGQDAGMTTDRFWEVTSAQFPEDHKEGWLQKLVDIEHLPKNNDPIFAVPEPKKKEETAKQKPANKVEVIADQDPSPPEDDGSSDGSNSADDDDMDLDDEEDYDDSVNSNQQKNGKGKAPTRGSRCSARLGGGSSDVPLGDPKVVDEEFKKIEGHHQTGVLLQKGNLRAGCRFGLRLVRNREDFDSLRKEEKNTGIEWMKYEQPWPDGFRQNPNTFPFPGLLKAGDGSSMGEVSGGGTDALSPAVTANGAPEASKSGGPIDVDPGGSDVLCDDGDDDLGDIYVALQGWVAHDAEDPEIRLRHRGYATEGALQSSAGEGTLQSLAGEGTLQSLAGEGAIQSSAGEGALHSSAGEGALQSSAGEGALQSSAGEDALQSSAGKSTLQSSAGEGALQSSAGEGALQSLAGEGALQSLAGEGALHGSAGEGAAEPSALSQGYPLPVLKDDVTELLGSMQAKLKEITDRSRGKVESIIDRSGPEVSTAADFRRYSDRLFKRLGRVQAWKTLYYKLEFGVADRPQNFNQTDASVVLDVPASWGRNAEGRQSKEEFEAQMRAHVEAANKEDAVCMVCFDGTTDDNKNIQIVYCDGCGMSVHQHCYGVKDVEADFCCERCRELRNIEKETGSADPEAVRCAICPVIHGALKKTCGNQWVHMACMLTIPGTRMDDLINKTQIDLSEVHVDPHIVPPLLQFPPDAPQLQQLAEQASLSHSLISSSVDVSAPGGDGAITSASLSAMGTAAVSAARATWEGTGSSGFGTGGEPSVWQALVQAHAQQAALGFYSGGMGIGAAGVNQAAALVAASSAAVDSAEEVDVSAPSPSYVRPKTSLLPPRRAPERELACYICLSTDGSLLDCGITECGAGGGGMLRHGEGPALCGAGGADGNRGDGIAVCGKRFHFLCAWFAGAYVKVSPTDPSFTRGERGLSGNMDTWPLPGQPRFGFPTGMAIEARCLEHSVGAPGRRWAPPGLARVVTPVGSAGGLAAAETFVEDTTCEEQAQLRSKYRFKGHPEWQLEGTKRKKSKSQMKKEDKKAERDQQQSSMRLSKPRALQADKYDRFACAVCMKSRQPLLGFRKEAETGGDSGGGAAGSEAAVGAPPAELGPNLVQCSACGVRVHRKCYGVPEDVGRPGAVSGDQWFCVPCSSRVSEPSCTLCPRKGGAFVRIRGAHYCHAFCAERTPGARLVDPLAAVEPLETAVTAKSEEALTVEGDAGTRKTGGKASKAKECSTFKAKVASVEEMGVVEVEEGDDEESASAGGGGTWSKRPAKSAVAGKVPRGGGAASGAGTGVGRGKAAFACAMTAETKCIPKDLKKSSNKCHICTRKGGVVVQCSYARTPCDRWMHPMCAAQNSRHSRRLSPEEAEATKFKSVYAFVCNDHVAACLRHISSGHWLDFLSLYRMRADLDRARVVFDCILRREKIKRQLHRTSSDLFDAALSHFRAAISAGAQALRERLDNIDAAAATATEVAAAAAAAAAAAERGDIGSGTRGRAAVSRAKEEADAAAAAAATAEAARTAAATRVSARGSSKKGGETKIAAAIASVPWYGKYSLIEDNALTLPENPELSYRPKMARAGDLGSSEFGRIRKKTLKAEEADGLKAGATDARRVFTAADSRRGGVERKGVSSGVGRGDSGRSARGGGGGGRSIAEGDAGDKRKHSSGADGGREKWPVISSAPAKRRKALWAPGKRPPAGREDSHALSKAAAERLVDLCVGSLPLQGIAASVLERGGGTADCSRAFPGHFGGLFKKLVGGCNVEPLMTARKAHKEAHPRPHREIPGLASPQQLLRDRQLKELCDTICEFRVDKEEGDPRWESGKAKPDDGKRDLGELFDEAPSRDSYPEYYAKVVTVMDLKTIKNKVLEHKYAGLDDLVQDIAVMYSNAQAIEHAQATKDAKRMLELAQRIAERLREEEREGKAHRQKKLEEPEESPAASRPPHVFCAKCDRLRATPSGKSLPVNIRQDNYWFCDACISESPETLTGHRIGVFWDGPGKWLAATINGYEPLSGKHKIVYWVDGHWEFISLGSSGGSIRYHHPLPPATLAPSPARGQSAAGDGLRLTSSDRRLPSDANETPNGHSRSSGSIDDRKNASADVKPVKLVLEGLGETDDRAETGTSDFTGVPIESEDLTGNAGGEAFPRMTAQGGRDSDAGPTDAQNSSTCAVEGAAPALSSTALSMLMDLDNDAEEVFGSVPAFSPKAHGLETLEQLLGVPSEEDSATRNENDGGKLVPLAPEALRPTGDPSAAPNAKRAIPTAREGDSAFTDVGFDVDFRVPVASANSSFAIVTGGVGSETANKAVDEVASSSSAGTKRNADDRWHPPPTAAGDAHVVAERPLKIPRR